MVVLSTILTAIFTVTGLVSALPPATRIGTTVTDKGFSVKQVARENVQPNGPYSVYRTYLKYGKTPPQWLQDAVAKYGGELGKRATGSAVNTPAENDALYLTPVQIGTPAQTLTLIFDTGSSDLWVFNDRTPTASVQGQTIFRSSQSSSARNVSGATWSIRYGDGSSSSGVVVTDVVSIGGYAVQNQTVELATTVSDQFVELTDVDGLLGLGFDTLNTVRPNQASTFFSTGKAGLDSPVFTADLKAGAPGTYDFGFIDSDKFTGQITYTNVNTTPGYWTHAATFGSTTVNGISDTGTTLLYLPDSIISRYYASIDGAGFTQLFGGYYVPCSATLPDFTFSIGSAQFSIPGEYINYAPLLGNACFGGIQRSDDIGLNIFGDVLLKSAFVVFEAVSGQTPRIGFAPKTLA